MNKQKIKIKSLHCYFNMCFFIYSSSIASSVFQKSDPTFRCFVVPTGQITVKFTDFLLSCLLCYISTLFLNTTHIMLVLLCFCQQQQTKVMKEGFSVPPTDSRSLRLVFINPVARNTAMVFN